MNECFYHVGANKSRNDEQKKQQVSAAEGSTLLFKHEPAQQSQKH